MRSHFPARNGINAALSYGYALATSAVETGVLCASLDALVGYHHERHRVNAALVCGLVEEHRPRVERMVLEVVHRVEPHAEHCGTAGEEAAARAATTTDTDDTPPAQPDTVRLRPGGRRVLVDAWKEVLSESRPRPRPRDDLATRRAHPATGRSAREQRGRGRLGVAFAPHGASGRVNGHVVVYDIPHDGRRRKLHDTLWATLRPVQYACFEGDLGAAGVRRLQGLVRRWLVDPGERLHVYTLCDTCRQRTQVLAGTDPTLPLPWTLGGAGGAIGSGSSSSPPTGGPSS